MFCFVSRKWTFLIVALLFASIGFITGDAAQAQNRYSDWSERAVGPFDANKCVKKCKDCPCPPKIKCGVCTELIDDVCVQIRSPECTTKVPPPPPPPPQCPDGQSCRPPCPDTTECPEPPKCPNTPTNKIKCERTETTTDFICAGGSCGETPLACKSPYVKNTTTGKCEKNVPGTIDTCPGDATPTTLTVAIPGLNLKKSDKVCGYKTEDATCKGGTCGKVYNPAVNINCTDGKPPKYKIDNKYYCTEDSETVPLTCGHLVTEKGKWVPRGIGKFDRERNWKRVEKGQLVTWSRVLMGTSDSEWTERRILNKSTRKCQLEFPVKCDNPEHIYDATVGKCAIAVEPIKTAACYLSSIQNLCGSSPGKPVCPRRFKNGKFINRGSEGALELITHTDGTRICVHRLKPDPKCRIGKIISSLSDDGSKICGEASEAKCGNIVIDKLDYVCDKLSYSAELKLNAKCDAKKTTELTLARVTYANATKPGGVKIPQCATGKTVNKTCDDVTKPSGVTSWHKVGDSCYFATPATSTSKNTSVAVTNKNDCPAGATHVRDGICYKTNSPSDCPKVPAGQVVWVMNDAKTECTRDIKIDDCGSKSIQGNSYKCSIVATSTDSTSGSVTRSAGETSSQSTGAPADAPKSGIRSLIDKIMP